MRNQKGFTLYIAVVISSVALLGAYAVSDTLLNQQFFSSDYFESQRALTLSEAGIECVRAYDRYEDAFNKDVAYKGTINCGDREMENGVTPLTFSSERAQIGGGRYSKFELFSGDACAVVLVDRTPGIPKIAIEIDSKGYSECSPGENPRRIQGAVRARY
jgi:hypothetical protein